MANFIKIHENDNVAVALDVIPSGTTVNVGGADVTTTLEVPAGHKFALADLAEGTPVIKYGFRIGNTTAAVKKGEWIHTHNLKTGLGDLLEYSYKPDFAEEKFTEDVTFMGYNRKNGKVGVRNEIWIIPTVGCVNNVASRIAELSKGLVRENIEAVCAFPHPYGCSQMGDDQEHTRQILANQINHPNAGGVLVLGLGCENLTMEQFKEELGEWDDQRVKFLVCQDVADEHEAGSALLQQLAEYAGQFRREAIPASELVVGMKCGGSDGLSGITANPTVGRFSDLLTSMGGSTILTEVPEMFGAEGILMERCQDEAVFQKAADMINGFKHYFASHGQVVYENPSPGNKAGGITTLEDKSCGCVQKGGSAPVVDVLPYGGQVKTKGLNMLSGPGNDLVSATALTAAGAHLILFTTGRGTPFGAPAPTVKISTNTALYEKKRGWIDFNAGTVAEGEPLDAAGRRLLDHVLHVAGGERTCTERHGFREISIFKDGVVL